MYTYADSHCCWQKSAQHYKAIVFQLKINLKNNFVAKSYLLYRMGSTTYCQITSGLKNMVQKGDPIFV